METVKICLSGTSAGTHCCGYCPAMVLLVAPYCPAIPLGISYEICKGCRKYTEVFWIGQRETGSALAHLRTRSTFSLTLTSQSKIMPRFDLSPTEIFLARHGHDVIAGVVAVCLLVGVIMLFLQHRWWRRLPPCLEALEVKRVRFPFPFYRNLIRLALGLGCVALYWGLAERSLYARMGYWILPFWYEVVVFILPMVACVAFELVTRTTVAVTLFEEHLLVYNPLGKYKTSPPIKIMEVRLQKDQAGLIRNIMIMWSRKDLDINIKNIDVLSLIKLRSFWRHIAGTTTIRPEHYRENEVQQSLASLVQHFQCMSKSGEEDQQ